MKLNNRTIHCISLSGINCQNVAEKLPPIATSTAETIVSLMCNENKNQLCIFAVAFALQNHLVPKIPGYTISEQGRTLCDMTKSIMAVAGLDLNSIISVTDAPSIRPS